MAAGNKPAAEHVVDTALVRGLLSEQHPDLADLSLREVASGWDNVIYRLGQTHCVRLPRRRLGADLVVHEQTWLPRLARDLPLPVPAPQRVGTPGRGYPWHWSICDYFDGETAAVRAPRDPLRAADQLGAFLAALHRPAPSDAPTNEWRGCPLSQRETVFAERLEQLGTRVATSAVRTVWERCLAAPQWAGAPIWLHGDLHPANILVHRGEISAVIDFGDITSGDPATDLAVAWTLFGPAARQRFRVAAGDVDSATWARARGWALNFALLFLANSANEPVLHRIGETTLAGVLADTDAP